MSEYSATAPSFNSSVGPRSPLFGTATYGSVQRPISPSGRSSSSLSYVETPPYSSGYDSDDASADIHTRRRNLSPAPDSASYIYSEEDSIADAAEVEAELTEIEEEIDNTLDAWGREPLSSPTNPFFDRSRHVLSTITEHTEDLSSRPVSFAPGSRPTTQYSDPARRTTNVAPSAGPSFHSRSATEPAGRPETPVNQVRLLAARFEAQSSTPSPFLQGHSRTASAPVGPRSPSPYTVTSQTMPTLSTMTSNYGYGTTTSGMGTTTGYGSSLYSYSSRPSSPTKSRTGSSITGPRPPTSMSNDSRWAPGSHSRSQSEASGYSTPSRTGTTNTNTFTGFTASMTGSEATTPTRNTSTTLTLRRPQASPDSTLTDVQNVVDKWKNKAPQIPWARSGSPTRSDGGRRRRSGRISSTSARSRRISDEASSDAGSSTTSRSRRSGKEIADDTQPSSAPPPIDVSQMGEGEPLNIGLLWYLNVYEHPFRWQRCQAILYPHMLHLTWLVPGGGRGQVMLDLLNCQGVTTALSPLHPQAKDDIGTTAAREQEPNEPGLLEQLSPLHLLYEDGTERLGTDSPRERLAWVNAIRESLDRPITIPDRSSTRSPNGSIRTIASLQSGTSQSSGQGSASTTYISPLHSGDLAELVSLSGSSSLSRRPSVATGLRGVDDNAIDNQRYLPHGDRRVIPPNRMSSLRRTSSLTDLNEEISSALERARNSRPGLGFGLSLASGDGSPVTISSGPRLGSPVSLTPPPGPRGPRSRSRSRIRDSETASSTSDEAFFSTSGTTRTPTSSFYSTSSSLSKTMAMASLETDTTTGMATDETVELAPGSNTNATTTTTSYLGSNSTALRLSSEATSPSTSSSSLSPSRGLARSRGVRRRTGTVGPRSLTMSYASGMEESSDKENTTSYSGSGSGSRPYTDELSTLDTLTRTTASYTSESWTRSETPTPSTVSSSRPTSEITSDFDRQPPLSSQTSDYVTASSKSPVDSLVSLPNIPSELDYGTAEVGSSTAGSEYITADVCRTETDYDSAEVCTTPAVTEFTTAEVCPTEVSTEFETAQCHCPKPAPASSIRTSPAPSAREVSIEELSEPEPLEEDIHSEQTPSEIPSIPSDVSLEEIQPEDIPLPPSSYTPSIPPSSILTDRDLTPPLGPPVATPSTDYPSLARDSTPSIPAPSPIPSSLHLPELGSISTVSSLTESSVTPTTSSELTPEPSEPSSLTVPSTVEQPTMSSPSIPESLWAAETDRSYDSSILRASPSTPSMAIPEGVDLSFETSFMRPTTVTGSSRGVSLITPISDLSTTPTIPVPMSRSLTLTPTPSSLSRPPSVPSPTPVSSEQSLSSITATPSTVSSTLTLTPSLPDAYPLPREVPSSPAPSFVPSLYSSRASTPSPPPSEAPPPSEPPLVILPPDSPTPSTPSVSMTVSVSTPRGTTPSIHSDLETVVDDIPEPPPPPPPPAPSQDLSKDVDRLMKYLEDIDQARGTENAELKGDVQEIRDLLANLIDELRERGEPVVQPPPVPHKDRSVGSASVVSQHVVAEIPSVPVTPKPLHAPQPQRPIREIVMSPTKTEPKTIYISPPRRRGMSPDTLSDGDSFLSSHHSDDWSLMESESYPALPRSPSWSSSGTSSPESSPSSSEASVRPRSVTLEDRPPSARPPSGRIAMPVPTRVLGIPRVASPTESSVSSRTIRPAQPIGLGDLRNLMDDLRREVGGLRDGQDAANRMLDEVRQRPETVMRDVPNIDDRLGRIENLLDNLLNRPATAGPPTDRAAAAPPSDVESSVISSDADSMFRTFRDFLNQTRRDIPEMRMPQPSAPLRPSFDEQLAELAASGIPLAPGHVQPPPPLIPLIYRPGPRLARPRSASPTFETELPIRPGTVPIIEPVVFDRPRVAPRVRRHRTTTATGPPSTVPPPSESDMPYDNTPRYIPSALAPVRPESGPDIDFLRRVRDARRERRGGDGTYIPGDGRSPSAPPDLGQEQDVPGSSWYRQTHGQPTSSSAATGVPPPGTFGNIPPATGALGGPQQGPTILLPTSMDDIIALLRENRLAQLATIDQQREIMRYMRGLNEWLERDVHDRQEEIRAVAARVDQLRDLMLQVLNNQGQAGQQPQAQPQQQQQPTFVMPPPGIVQPPVMPPGPMFPQPETAPHVTVQPQQWPEGFVPNAAMGVPVQPGPFTGYPPSRRTPTPEYSPVIPRRPEDMYDPRVPVIPGQSPTGTPGPYRRQRPPTQAYDDAPPVVPQRPSPDRSSTSSGMYTDEQRPGETITIIPPPGREQYPMPDPTVMRLPTSRVSSSSEGSGGPEVHVHPPSPAPYPIPPPQQPQQQQQQPTIIISPAPQGTQPGGLVVQPPPIGGYSGGMPSSYEGPPQVIQQEPPQQPITVVVGSHRSSEGSRSPSRVHYRPSRTHSRSRSRSRSGSRSPSRRFEVAPSPQPVTVLPPGPGMMPGMQPYPVPAPATTILPVPPPTGPTYIPDPTRSRRSRSPPQTVVIRTGSTHRSRSRSPRHYDDRRRSRSPRHYDDRSRRPRSRSPRRSDYDRGRSPSRTHHRSRSRSPIILREGSEREPRTIVVPSSRRGDSRSPTRIVVGDTGRRYSRSPTHRHRSRSRSRSRSPRFTVIPSSERSRRSPERIIAVPPAISRHRSSPERVIVTGPSEHSRRHSRSRSPRPVIVRTEGSRRHSRSRSRSPRPVIVRTEGSRRHSRSRSRSPRPVRIRTEGSRRHSRSRSPRPIIVGSSGSRRRSRSRSPVIVRTEGSRHRSRSPVIVRTTSSRRRSRSPTYGDPSRRGSRTPHRVLTRSHRTHSRRGSRSPEYSDRDPRRLPTSRTHRTGSPYSDYEDDGRRRRRSRSPREVRPSRGYRATSRDRSPVTLHRTHSPGAPVVVRGTTHRSRSPTLVGSRAEPITVRVETAPSGRSRRRSRSGGSRSPSLRYPLPRSHTQRSRSLSPSGTRRRISRSPSSTPVQAIVRSPSQRSDHRRPRRGPPTIVPVPGTEYAHDHSPPLTAEPHLVRLPSERTTRTHRTPAVEHRIPSGVTEHEYPSHAATPYVGPLHSSPAHSDVSALHDAFSQGEPSLIHVPPPRRPRPRSPSTTLRDQLRTAQPDVPVIPYVPSTPSTQVGQEDVPISIPISPRRIPPTIPESPTPLQVPPPTSEAEPIRVIRTIPRSPSPRHPPITVVPSYPGDLGYADEERVRAERFSELAHRMAEHIDGAEEAEIDRDRHFRDNEDDRQRIFIEHEDERDRVAQQHREQLEHDVHGSVQQHLASLPPARPASPERYPHEGPPPSMPVPEPYGGPPEEHRLSEVYQPSESSGDMHMVPPPDVERHDYADVDVHTLAQSIQSGVVEATSAPLREVLDTIQMEREELRETRADIERVNAELQEARDQNLAQMSAQLAAAREELAAMRAENEQLRGELEQERQLRITVETERREAERMEDRERAEAVTMQLSEVTTIVQETRDEVARKRETSDERWAQKETWQRDCHEKMDDCKGKMDDMKEMMSGLQRMFEESERQRQADREAEAAKPGIDSIVEELRHENGQLRELFRELSDGLTAESKRQHESILDAVRATAQEQVPFNISGYLDEFSKTLSKEVRQLLAEVNDLVENKSRLQFEIATLLEFKAKYEPGGFFWKQGGPQPPVLQPEQPPADLPPPPPPGPPEAAHSAWRSVRPRGRGRKPRESAPAPAPAAPAAPPPGPGAPPAHAMTMGPRPGGESWATWQPSERYQPSPASSVPSAMLVPEVPTPGLFGPRTPRESMYRQ